jgi:type II secretory pathway component PulF
MKFKISAVAADGNTYGEVIEAADRFEVYRIVRERGDKVIALQNAAGGFSLSTLTGFLNAVSLTDKILFARNLASMLEAGLPVSRALGVMERQTRNPRFKTILEGVAADVNRGSALSAALAKYEGVFPSLMISMSRAGEESGTLAESLRAVSVQLDRTSSLTKKIRSALIYPSIILFAIIGSAILMLLYVVPTLTQTFTELHVQLPLLTRVIIGASSFLVNHTFLSLVSLIALFVVVVLSLKTAPGKRFADWLMLHIPLIRGIVIEANAARTARTLSSLLSAGVDMVFALVITRDVLGNSYYQQVLAAAETSVTKGGTLSAVFNEYPDLYPPLIPEMLAVGEETGRVSEMLKETAEFYEESVDRMTRDLSTVVEPLLMILVGAGVGLLALGILEPIYSLSSSIS